MKRIILFAISLLLLLALGGYTWLKWHVLKVKDFAEDDNKKTSIVDLRPALIARIQQLVKDGSDSLYHISIGSLTPHIVGATLEATDVTIAVDSNGYHRLQQQNRLPDDLFSLSFRKLHIDGIGIEDLLHTDKVKLQNITLVDPQIKAWHKKLPYNSLHRHIDSQLTLYQKFTRQLHSIAIGHITITDGEFTDYNADSRKQTIFNDFSVQLDHILVDSTTQFDTTRFLFAQHAFFKTSNYTSLTSDSLYEFRIGALEVTGEKHQIDATDVSFKPRGTRQQFESHLKTRQEMFTIILPHISFWDVDWWSMLHRESLVARKGLIEKGTINIYLNRSLPKSRGMTMDNFPQQLLAKLDAAIAFDQFDIHDLDLSYEEYSPQTSQAGMVKFIGLQGKALNVTNIPAKIKANKQLTIKANTFFMGKIPMRGRFDFNLLKSSSGAFTATVALDAMDATTLNSFAEPLGQLSITSGHVNQAQVHLSGNNNQVNGSVTASYTGLHIATLKEKHDQDGRLKQRKIETALANVLVKNNNPGGNGKLRIEQFTMDRGDHGNYFNFIWSATKMGLLKTVGIPPALGLD